MSTEPKKPLGTWIEEDSPRSRPDISKYNPVILDRAMTEEEYLRFCSRNPPPDTLFGPLKDVVKARITDPLSFVPLRDPQPNADAALADCRQFWKDAILMVAKEGVAQDIKVALADGLTEAYAACFYPCLTNGRWKA